MRFKVWTLPAKGEKQEIEVDCGDPDNDASYTVVGVSLVRDDGAELPLVYVDDFYGGSEEWIEGKAPATVYLHVRDGVSTDEATMYHLRTTELPNERKDSA